MSSHPRFRTAGTALLLLAAVACQSDRRSNTTPDAAVPESTTGLPTGWEVRLDQPGDEVSGVEFRNAEPGYMVRTGPAAILFNPVLTVSADFYGVASFVQLKPTAHGEAYGLFVGGKDLQSVVQSYVYFMIRQDGKFLIKRRIGAETSSIEDWTDHAAIARQPEGGDAPENTLRIDAGPDAVMFSINGEEVARLPRSDIDVDGIVGLRVNHGLELAIPHFEVVPQDIPVPERATQAARSSWRVPPRPATAG